MAEEEVRGCMYILTYNRHEEGDERSPLMHIIAIIPRASSLFIETRWKTTRRGLFSSTVSRRFRRSRAGRSIREHARETVTGVRRGFLDRSP